MTKHSGADWLLRSARVSRLSPLGVIVGNVLGQVELGIYHLEGHLRGKRAPDWAADDAIYLTRSRELASFDGCELTLLMLCCQAAGLDVDISGHSSGLLELKFTRQQPLTIPEPSPELVEGCLLETYILKHRISNQTGFDSGQNRFKWARTRHDYWTEDAGQPVLKNVEFSVRNNRLAGRIPQMLVDAHQAGIRLAIRSLSPSTMGVQISRRSKREGRFWERHPTWDVHRERLKPYWDIDYSSTT